MRSAYLCYCSAAEEEDGQQGEEDGPGVYGMDDGGSKGGKNTEGSERFVRDSTQEEDGDGGHGDDKLHLFKLEEDGYMYWICLG